MKRKKKEIADVTLMLDTSSPENLVTSNVCEDDDCGTTTLTDLTTDLMDRLESKLQTLRAENIDL